MKVFRAISVLLLLASVAMAAESPVALLAAGKADEATQVLQQRLSANPNDAETHSLMGRVYFQIQNWDRAIEHGEKAVNLAPNNSNFYLWLARAYGEKADSSPFWSAVGWAKKTRAAFERAVELDKSSVAARSDLTEFYVEAPGIVGGGIDKARAQAQELLKLDPVKGHWANGRIAEKSGNPGAAEQEYKAALDAAHGDTDGWLNLLQFYRRGSRWPEFDNAAQKLSAAPVKNPETLVDAVSTMLRAERNLPLAAQLDKRYLGGKTVEEAPVFKAHLLLGRILEKQADKNGAAAEYRAALALASTYKPAADALKKLGQ